MRLTDNASSPLEKCVSAAILLTLAVIAVSVLIVQRRYHPAVQIAASVSMHTIGDADGEQSVPRFVPSSLIRLSAAESFTPDNLYDKIDGKAELYLAAGFSNMRCQRYALRDAPDQWLEWFEYRMNGVPQAFSVFSTQRRAEGEPLEFVEHGYRTPNALFFVTGSSYVEVVASSSDSALMEAALEMAAGNVASAEEASGALAEMKLLPPQHLVAGTQSLQTSDAFGFDQFKNVYTATYRIGAAEVTGFVLSTPGAAEAAVLAEAYEEFLLANGGKKLNVATELGRAIEIMGTVEIVFSEGPVVAGVHSAPDRAVAEELARLLKAHLASQ